MVKTNDQLHTEIAANFPDNTVQAITPALLRATVLDLADSAFSYASYLTADTTVQVGSINYCDTTSGAFSVTLPASPTTGAIVSIRDAKGTWATSNLSVLPGGNNIETLAGTLTCDTADANFDLVWRGGGVGWGVEIILAPWARAITTIRAGAAAMHGIGALAGVGLATATAGAMHAAGVGGLALLSSSFVAANWNPADKSPDITLSGGNLIATKSAAATLHSGVRGTPGYAPSHRYFEAKGTVFTDIGFGLANATHTLTNYLGSDSANAVAIFGSGFQVGPGVSTSGNQFGVNDVIGIELISNLSGDSATFRINGVVERTFTTLPPGTLYPAISIRPIGDSATANFGATPFDFPIPTGAIAWNSP